MIPEINGLLEGYRTSRQYVIEHRESFERAGQAIMQQDHGQRARRRGAAGDPPAPTATTGGHTPDLQKAKS